jgi:hypothetical protein
VDKEVMKRSGRDEPVCVAIHKCIEAMLGISLYSYLYLKLAKTLSFSLSFMLFSYKIGEQEGRTLEVELVSGGEVAQRMYTHVSKCRNDKIT